MGLTLIASVSADEPGTGSGEATLSFLDGSNGVVFDNTYDEYQFQFVNMHPEDDNANFVFQVNAADGADFNETMTTTGWYAYNRNTAGASNLTYDANVDQAQEAGYQWILAYDVANDTEGSVSGILTLYDPSSTTFVKHFTAVGQGIAYGTYSVNMYNDGYINTTNAIDEISFKFDDGDIDDGTIYMYGVS